MRLLGEIVTSISARSRFLLDDDRGNPPLGGKIRGTKEIRKKWLVGLISKKGKFINFVEIQ